MFNLKKFQRNYLYIDIPNAYVYNDKLKNRNQIIGT